MEQFLIQILNYFSIHLGMTTTRMFGFLDSVLWFQGFGDLLVSVQREVFRTA